MGSCLTAGGETRRRKHKHLVGIPAGGVLIKVAPEVARQKFPAPSMGQKQNAGNGARDIAHSSLVRALGRREEGRGPGEEQQE